MSKAHSWECQFQQRIVFEVGGAKKLGGYLPDLTSNKVLVVTDKGVLGAGLLDEVLDGLTAAGIDSVVFDGVQSDAPSDVIIRASTEYADQGLGAVIAVGGGSTIDTAKCIAISLTNPGNILDYVGFDLVKNRPLPIVAVPTTAGTGSEVTNAAIITNHVSHAKVSVATEQVVPGLALLDPLMIRSCPPRLAAGSGLDALSHAIEAYTATTAIPVTDGLAAEAIRLIGASIRTYVGDPDNLDAASDMIAGSSLACLAVVRGGLRLGAVHATAEVMGGYFHTHHGLSCGLLMPAVAKYNMFASPAKYARIAELLGERVNGLSEHEAARMAFVALQKLNDDLPIPKNLAEAGIDREYVPRMAADVMVQKFYIVFNARKVTQSAVEQIYHDAF